MLLRDWSECYTEIRLHRELCVRKGYTHCKWTVTSTYSWWWNSRHQRDNSRNHWCFRVETRKNQRHDKMRWNTPSVNQYCDKWIATVPKSMSRGHSAVLELQRYVDIVKKTLQKAKREKTPPSLCSVFVRLPSKQDYRHLQKCYLAERFSPTYPSSPPRGKRKHVFTEENNGDDIMMNMHVTWKTYIQAKVSEYRIMWRKSGNQP